jgi:NADH oxidase (H2O2-forming)
MTKIVIIGLGAAGFGAALAAKKQDRKAEITILDEKDFDLMHQCGLPFVLDGKIKYFSDLMYDINAERMGMKLLSRCNINKVDFSKKRIHYKKKGREEEAVYDRLIIAVGSKPFIPPISTKNKVYTVHNINDTKEIQDNIKKGKKAIVVGAGAIGLEVAAALNEKGMRVKVMDMVEYTFPKSIDRDMSQIIEEKLNERGIKLELGQKISEIKENAVVVMATGVKPNIDFLADSGIKIHKFGIEVNERMETSVKDVYAAGDCCCIKSFINNEKVPSQLANNAYKEGAVAGTNAAGGNDRFKGMLGTFVSMVDGIEISATGFNSFFADCYGIKTVNGKAKGKSKPIWFGDSGELTIKLIADENGRILGGQAIGDGAKERINIVSTAIKAKFTLKDLADLELSYCPAVSDYYDVLVIASEVGLRKLVRAHNETRMA